MDGRVWDAMDGTQVLSLGRHSRWLSGAVAFSPTSATLAFCCDGRLQLWDVPSGRKRLSVPKRDRFDFIAISPGDRLVATVTPDAPVRIWQAGTGELHVALEAPGGPVECVVFSPDGSMLVVAGKVAGASQVWFWDTDSGKLRASLAGHDGVGCVAFSRDGKTLATGGGITPQLWDAETHALRATLSGHTQAVLWAAFSPDGRTLATASDDRTVRLWHVATGQELFTLEAHTGPVRYVAFYPDGRRLLSAGTGADGRGEFYVWSAAENDAPSHTTPSSASSQE